MGGSFPSPSPPPAPEYFAGSVGYNNWNSAKSYCESNGAILATFDDNTQLSNLVNKCPNTGTTFCYTGWSNDNQDHIWEFVDGAKLDKYAGYWAPNEPHGGTWNCGLVKYGYTNQIYDGVCSGWYGSPLIPICERPGSSAMKEENNILNDGTDLINNVGLRESNNNDPSNNRHDLGFDYKPDNNHDINIFKIPENMVIFTIIIFLLFMVNIFCCAWNWKFGAKQKNQNKYKKIVGGISDTENEENIQLNV